MFCTWGLGFRVYIKTVYARRGGGISWYLKRGVGLHLVLDVQELGLLELNLGFKRRHHLLDRACAGWRLRLVLEANKARRIGGFFGDPSLPLGWFRRRLVRGRLQKKSEKSVSLLWARMVKTKS